MLLAGLYEVSLSELQGVSVTSAPASHTEHSVHAHAKQEERRGAAKGKKSHCSCSSLKLLGRFQKLRK